MRSGPLTVAEVIVWAKKINNKLTRAKWTSEYGDSRGQEGEQLSHQTVKGGSIIADAIDEVGPNGVLSFEYSSSFESNVNVEEATEIDKIEGLNAKAQISDGRTEARPTREEKEKQLGIMDPKVVLSASRSISSAAFKEKSNTSSAFNSLHKGSMVASIVDGGYEPTAVGRVMPNVEETQASSDSIVGERTQFQMRGQALQSRADYRGRGRFSSQE